LQALLVGFLADATKAYRLTCRHRLSVMPMSARTAIHQAMNDLSVTGLFYPEKERPALAGFDTSNDSHNSRQNFIGTLLIEILPNRNPRC
jgi:hypothetical protein